MSAVSKESGGWLARNLDKLVLVASLMLLLASSIYLLLSINGEQRELKDADFMTAHVRPRPAEPIDIAAYRSNLVVNAQAFDGSTATSNRLVASEDRVSCVNPECRRPIPYTAQVCPWCQARQPKVVSLRERDFDGDGIPDVIERQLGLDPRDPRDGLADLDGDGFTNAEEHQFGSDMNDSTSFPPPGKKLRLVRAVPQPLNFLFKGKLDRDGGESFQINSLSDGRTFFRQLGEEIEGYTLDAYDESATDGPTLILRKGDSVLPLALNRSRVTNEWNARLISLLDGSQYPPERNAMLPVGAEIELRGYTYKVIDINSSAVLIQDTNSSEEVAVESLTRAEYQDLMARMQGRARTTP